MRWLLGLAALVFALPAHAIVEIDWVEVGEPGNASDDEENCFAADCGSVPYRFSISTYEVTNAQYAELLNAKAASDPFGLYDTAMSGYGITRHGAPGSYTYEAEPGFASKPVVFVRVWDALRFANWLHNGQGGGDTEAGAYTITAEGIAANSITRNPSAVVFLPSENEWYKAAYYDGLSATYFDYPAGSDAATACASPLPPQPNTANCSSGAATDVGAYTASASPYGTFDQGGNVWEWNEQIVDGSFRGLRGGGWFGGAGYLAAADRGYVGLPPVEFENMIGFRVASLVPEPGASQLGLASFASLAALTRRRARSG